MRLYDMGTIWRHSSFGVCEAKPPLCAMLTQVASSVTLPGFAYCLSGLTSTKCAASEMGNVLGFVRMMRQAGLRHCSAALCIANGRSAAPDTVRCDGDLHDEDVSGPLLAVQCWSHVLRECHWQGGDVPELPWPRQRRPVTEKHFAAKHTIMPPEHSQLGKSQPRAVFKIPRTRPCRLQQNSAVQLCTARKLKPNWSWPSLVYKPSCAAAACTKRLKVQDG